MPDSSFTLSFSFHHCSLIRIRISCFLSAQRERASVCYREREKEICCAVQKTVGTVPPQTHFFKEFPRYMMNKCINNRIWNLITPNPFIKYWHCSEPTGLTEGEYTPKISVSCSTDSGERDIINNRSYFFLSTHYILYKTETKKTSHWQVSVYSTNSLVFLKACEIQLIPVSSGF